MRGGAVAARRAHNPKVAGSSPAPATKKDHDELVVFVFNPEKLPDYGYDFVGNNS